jgi:putative exporter of polyketide antibiotics
LESITRKENSAAIAEILESTRQGEVSTIARRAAFISQGVILLSSVVGQNGMVSRRRNINKRITLECNINFIIAFSATIGETTRSPHLFLAGKIL